jgi:nucleoside-diphosphate-sugar epimerase
MDTIFSDIYHTISQKYRNSDPFLRILIIGANGFLGSHVASFLKNQKDDKDILVLCTTRSLGEKKEWIYLDVTRPETFCNLPEHIDIIYYMAMSPNYHNFPEYANDIWEVNVQGLFRTLEYARQVGVKHFILASSGSVYAQSKRILSENSALAIGSGSDFYTTTKIAAETLLNSYVDFFSVSCLRFFYPYGKGLKTSMLLSRMVHNIRNRIPIVLDGKDGFKFNPIYIDDAVTACVAALLLEGFHTVNVAGPQETTLGEVCRIIGELLKCEPNFISGGKSKKVIADIEYMCNILSNPRITIREGMKNFIG